MKSAYFPIKILNRVSMRSLMANISAYNLRRAGGEFFWIGMGQVMAVLGAIVGVRWITQLLDPQCYGELALGLTLTLFTQQAIWGPLGGGISRFFAPALEALTLKGYLKATRILVGRISLSSLLIAGLVCAGGWALGYGHLVGLAGLAMLLGLTSGYCGSLNAIQYAARQRMVVAWHQGLGAWLRFMVAVGFIYLWGPFSWVVMLGYCGASFIVLCSQFLFFKRKILISGQQPIKDNEVSAWTEKLVKYSWPISIFGIFTWAQIASDRWALQCFGIASDVGLYTVLYQVGYYPIMTLSGLVTQFIQPVIFAWAGDNTDEGRVQRTRIISHALVTSALILTAIGTLLAFLLHEQIFYLLVGIKYRVVASLLPLMVLAGGLFTAGQLASLILMTENNTRGLIAPKIFTAIFGILLNIAGAYFMGLRGVVLACLLFALSYALWVIYLSRNQGKLVAQ